MQGAVVIGAIIGIAIGLAIGAMLLRIACGIVTKSNVPDFAKAMGIVAVAGVANAALGFFVGLVVGMAMQGDPEAAQLTAQLLGLPVGAVASASIYMLMLPTDFGKALLIWLVQAGIVLAIAIVIGIIIGITGAMG